MADSLAGLVLAAGAGTRLWPLTAELPKALCPLGDRALVDHRIDQLAPVVGGISANVHHGAPEVQAHLEQATTSVHVSVEQPVALGTAGAIGNLAGWLDGRDLLVVNADTYTTADLAAFVAQWDRSRTCVLTDTPGGFGPGSGVVASIVPAGAAAGLSAAPSGLWEVLWGPEVAAGRMQTVHTDAPVIDCGSPARYLAANLAWLRNTGGRTDASGSWFGRDCVVTGDVRDCVVGTDARVEGTAEGCVVWPGAEVGSAEALSNSVRTGLRTVMIRP